MTEEAARRGVAEYWVRGAETALASAASEFAARRYEMKRLLASQPGG